MIMVTGKAILQIRSGITGRYKNVYNMEKDPKDITVFVSSILPDIGIEMLRKTNFNVTTWDEETPVPKNILIEKAKQSNALLSTLTAVIDADFLNECNHLDIISQFGVGYDNINLPEATKCGIPVGNTPGVLTDATADVAFGLMIAVSRKMFFMHKKIGKGEWRHFTPT